MSGVKKFIASIGVKAVDATLVNMPRKDILELMDIANLTPDEHEVLRRTYVYPDDTQVKSAMAMSLSLSAFQQRLKSGRKKIAAAVRTSTHS